VRISRRGALGLGVGALCTAVVAACSRSTSTGSPPGLSSTAPPDSVAVTSSTVATSTTAPAPDPAAVAAANSGRVPTQWGLAVDGVHTQLVDSGSALEPTLALTFDACGGPGGSGVDRALLDVLGAEGVPATLFLNRRWIEANPVVVQELVSSPLFEIGNHGTRHLPLSVNGREAYGITGTADADEAAEEVWVNHGVLTDLLGRPPVWFRSGTAHYDEVATAIAQQLGEQPVGFTTNGDFGATASAQQVVGELTAAPAGGIVLAHMNQPASATSAGIATAVAQLRSRGVRFVTLSGGGGTRP
jgi:peptidoglycan/xylan/chitin deacetylase (PgdA/CDA1 family)